MPGLMQFGTRHIYLFLIGLILLTGCSEPEPPRVPDARPSEWAYLQRTWPSGQWNPNAYHEAYEQAERLKALSKRGVAIGTWQVAGPTNIGGRISDVEFDPQRPNIIFAGAATGGVFKSEDSGQTWRAVFDGYAVVNVGDIGISESNSDVMYVGTGEPNGTANNIQGAGVFKSVDGGESWSFVGLEKTAAVGRIVVHPTNPDHVYVAAVGSYFNLSPDRGVFRSTDGGANWERVLAVSDSTGAIDLVMNPDDPDILYAAMWQRLRRPDSAILNGRECGVYRTRDGGDTWEELGPANGLPDPKAVEVGRIGLAISRDHPDVVFAHYTDGFDHLGLFKTSNGGDKWINFDPGGQIADAFKGFARGFSWFFSQVRVSPTDTNSVYVMDVEFAHTRDGGQTWGVNPGTSVLHVDHHALAFHPQNPEFIIEGNDGGLNVSVNGGANWTKIDGLPVTQFYEVAIDPRFPDQIYGGTQDNENVWSETGSINQFQTLKLGFGSGGDGFDIIIAYEEPTPGEFYRVIYAESQLGGLFKSLEGSGQGFQSLRAFLDNVAPSDPRNWSTPIAMDPNNTAVIYYGTHRLLRSDTRGTTWHVISDVLTDYPGSGGFGTITTIDVSPHSSDTILLGTDDGNVWITRDLGNTWIEITGTLPTRWVTRVSFDPVEPSRIYATFSGLKWDDPLSHVFRSENLGESWIDISGNLPDAPVNAFAIDPIDTDVIYVGSDVGAFMSFNRGSDWEPIGQGLPAVAVYDLEVHHDPHFLLAGTHGRSMYKIDLSAIVTSAGPDDAAREVPVAISDAANYPNPFSERTTLTFDLDRPSNVRAEIFDIAGRRISVLHDGPLSGGRQQIVWAGRDDNGLPAPNGVYLYRLVDGGQGGAPITGRMVLAR